MVRRRIKSGGQVNFSESDLMKNLSALSDLSEDELDENALRGTSQEIPLPEMIDFPQVPRNPELYEDKFGVDDVPGIPEGIELLGDLAESESAEDTLDMIGDTKPPAQMRDMSQQRSGLGGLQDPLEFLRMRIQEDPELANDLPEETLQLLASTTPDPEKRFTSTQRDAVEEQEVTIPEEGEEILTQEKITETPSIPPSVEALPEQGTGQEVREEDIPQEGLGAIPGSVEKAKNDPELVRNVENLLKLKRGDIPKEAWDHIELTEKVLTQQEENLNEREKQYKQKLERGDLSTFDKVAIGIALALPFIIGLTYGKDAAIAGLGGTLTGLSEGLAKEEEINLKNLGKIGEIQKEKQGIAEKRAKLKEEYLKNVENPSLKKLLNNYDVVNVSEGPNGEPQLTIGKDAMVIGNSIGLSAGDESGVLWYDTNQIRDDDDVKNFKTAIKEGKVALGKMKDANRTIDDIVDVMSVIKEQQPSLYNAFLQNFNPLMYTDKSSLKKLLPGTSKALTIEVVGDDGQVRKVQALPLLKQKITSLQDVYNKEYLGGNKLTEALLKHWNDIFPDPSSVTSWLKSDFNTMSQQAQNFKNTLNQRAVENLAAEGFLRDPLEKILPIKGGDILQSSSIDMQDIEENPEKYRSKVKK